MRPDRVLSLLGIAMKGGSVYSGEYQTEKAVKEGRAYLVIVAGDASDNTKKRFRDMCQYHEVPFYTYADREQLGACIGKQFRASLSVNNEGLAHSLIDYLSTMTTE